jgi:hypothetical protein
MEKKEQGMVLKWGRCEGHDWCPLLEVNLSCKYFDDMEGVYIIWYGDDPYPYRKIVRVGQGFIKDRLTEHGRDPEILEYKPLYVTWARVKARSDRDGIECYLGKILRPLTPEEPRFPDVEPISVNLPWDEWDK